MHIVTGRKTGINRHHTSPCPPFTQRHVALKTPKFCVFFFRFLPEMTQQEIRLPGTRQGGVLRAAVDAAGEIHQ
jgi:hypothetical protein